MMCFLEEHTHDDDRLSYRQIPIGNTFHLHYSNVIGDINLKGFFASHGL
jgi:hypothetical protein